MFPFYNTTKNLNLYQFISTKSTEFCKIEMIQLADDRDSVKKYNTCESMCKSVNF